jgi:hypothetical protein
MLQKMSHDGIISTGLLFIQSFRKLVSLHNDIDTLIREMQHVYLICEIWWVMV